MSAFLARHWFLLLLTLGLGLAMMAPDALHHATDLLHTRSTIAISLVLVAITMPTHSLVDEVRRPYASMWAVFLSYAFVPLAASVIGFLTPSRDVRIGLILISSVPCTMAAAIIWTRLAGGNAATALLTVVGTTFTSWFLTPACLFAYTGAVLELDLTGMMLDLVLILIVPVAIGQAIRFIPLGARVAEKHKIMLGVVSQAIILAMVLKAGVVVGQKMQMQGAVDAPAIFLWSVGLAVGLHLLVLTSALHSSRWLGFDRGRQIAVAIAASQKTLPVSLVLYDEYFKTEYPFAVMPILFYHAGQLLLDTVIAGRLAKTATFSSPEPSVGDNI